LHWPESTDLELWPFAIDYAVYLWNHMPQRSSLMASIELYSSIKLPSYDPFLHAHVFGCLVFVLDPRLQDGKKLPKWTPRAHRGKFLHYSPQHSTLVGHILNLSTVSVTPQVHVVYDDLFSTVTWPVDSPLPESSWNSLLSFGYENCLDHDVPAPLLSLEWLSPAEVADIQRKSCGSQGFHMVLCRFQREKYLVWLKSVKPFQNQMKFHLQRELELELNQMRNHKLHQRHQH